MVLPALVLGVGVHGGVLAPAQAVDLIPQESRMLEFQQLGGLLHLPGQALDSGLPLQFAHPAGVPLCVLGLVADLDAVGNGLDDGFGHDAVFFVVGHLDSTAALGLGDGTVHAVRHLIRVHDDKALGVAGGAADGLDEAGLAAQEALLVRIKDGHKAHLRQVQTLAQEVDAHHHIDGAQTQILDDLHPLEGVHLVVHIFDLDPLLGQEVGQVLGHFLGQGGHQDPLVLLGAGMDLPQQIGDLPLHGAH